MIRITLLEREMRVAAEINLAPEERSALMKLARSGRISVRLAQRARIVLLASRGMQNNDIAAELNVGRVQAGVGVSAMPSRALQELNVTCRAVHPLAQWMWRAWRR